MQVFILIGLIAISLFSFESYSKTFVEKYNEKTSEEWQYEYKQIFEKYGDSSNYDKVIISDKYAQPYIFSLFYNQYNSETFRNQVKYNSPSKWGMSTVANFANYDFREATAEDYKKGNIIFTSQKDMFKVKAIDQLKFLNGETALYVFKP